MTTPSTFNTPYRLITMAMVDAGYLAEGDTPDSEMLASYMDRLNDVINFQQTQGVKVYLQNTLPIPLVSGKAKYSIGPGGDVNMLKPTRILDSSFFMDVSGTARPLIPCSQDEYNRLSTKSQTGPITQFFVDKQPLVLNVNFWLTPDDQAATGSAQMLMQVQHVGPIELTDQMQFPPEWFIGYRWALADEICTGQPEAVINRCAAKAQYYLDALKDWDVEDADTTFQPDQRMYQGYGRFI